MKSNVAYRIQSLLKLADITVDKDELMSFAKDIFIRESKGGPINTPTVKLKVAKRLLAEFDVPKSELRLIVEGGLILAQDAIRFRAERERELRDAFG